MTNRRQLMQSALASVLGLTHLPNFAQTRLENLRIIVGFPPGGTTDAFSRRIAEKMRGTYANNVIVDNKPGAGGQIGVTTLKSAAADGAAVPDSVKNIKDFVEWAKANPGKASIGNPAAGSMPHLLAGRLAMLGGFQITNVPFAGSGPAIPQVMGGQLAGMSSPLGDWVQHHKSGKIRILATSGPDRAVFTPDVATFREQGFGELMVREWFGFFAPAGISEAVRQNLNTALRQAMGQQDIRDFVTPLAANLEASTSAEHTRRLAEDSEMAKRLVTALGFKADS